MTPDALIADARLNKTEPADANSVSPHTVSGALRWALELLLEDFDYEADMNSNSAVAVRLLATIIVSCDEMKESPRPSSWG